MKHHLPTDTRQPPTARACAAFLEAYRARRATPNYEALARAICERWPLDPEQTARFARLALAGRTEMLDPRAPQWRAAAVLLDVSLADALGPALSAVRPLPPERTRAVEGVEEVEEVEEDAPACPPPSTTPAEGVRPEVDVAHGGAEPPRAINKYQAAWAAEAAKNLKAIMDRRGLSVGNLVDMIASVSPDRTRPACSTALTDALRGRRVWTWVWSAAVEALKIEPSRLCTSAAWLRVIDATYSADPTRRAARTPQHTRVAVKAAHAAAVRKLVEIMRDRNISTSDLLALMVATGRVSRRDAMGHAFGLYGLRRSPTQMWKIAADALGVDLSDISPSAAWVALASGDRAHVPGSPHMVACAEQAASSALSIARARGVALRDISRMVAAIDPLGGFWRKWYSSVCSITGPKRPTISPLWPAIAAALGVNLSDLCADPIWLREQPAFKAKT